MDQASNLRACYRILEDKTKKALQTQIGDHQRLSAIRDDVLMFGEITSGVRVVPEKPHQI